jgi:hypothetical protein
MAMQNQREHEVDNVSPLRKQEEERLVDGGYSWIVVLSMTLITAHTRGIIGVSRSPSLTLK